MNSRMVSSSEFKDRLSRVQGHMLFQVQGGHPIFMPLNENGQEMIRLYQ